MTGRIRGALGALGLLAMGATAPVTAQAQEVQSYTVSIAGLNVGTASLAVNTAGDRYSAEARIRGRGLVGRLFDFGYVGNSSGRIVSNFKLQPDQYRANKNSSGETRAYYLDYRGGLPVRAETVPPTNFPQYAPDPSKLGGSLDPISAAWTLLRDVPVGQACNRSTMVYDASRSFRVWLQPREQAGDLWSCAGAYSREGGFSPRKLAEQKVFPFKVFFREDAGMMRAVRVEVVTTYGTARATRN